MAVNRTCAKSRAGRLPLRYVSARVDTVIRVKRADAASRRAGKGRQAVPTQFYRPAPTRQRDSLLFRVGTLRFAHPTRRNGTMKRMPLPCLYGLVALSGMTGLGM